MRNRSPRRIFASLLICVACLAMAACRPSLNGTYHMETGGFALDFRSGGKVTISGLGESQTFDYRVEGDKVIVMNFDNGQNLELTRNSDGSLNSPIGTFRKRT